MTMLLRAALALGAIVFLGILPATAHGATVVVDGSDGQPDALGCGDEANPCRTIATGVSNANAGDLVRVAAGEYTERVSLDKPLTLEGAQAGVDPRDGARGEESVVTASPAADPSAETALTVTADDVAVRGFELRPTPNNYAVAVMEGATGTTLFENRVVSGPAGRGLLVAGGDATEIARSLFVGGSYGVAVHSSPADGLMIADNIFELYRGATAIETWAAASITNFWVEGNVSENAFSFSNVSGLVIADNRVSHRVIGYDPPVGVRLMSARDVLVIGNTLANNGGAGIVVGSPGGEFPASSGVEVTGNTLAENGVAGLAIDSYKYGKFSAYDGILELHSNRIVGNGAYGVANQASETDPASGAVGAEDNWWGCNGGTGAEACDVVDGEVYSEPHLVWRLRAPTRIAPLATAVLAGDLTVDSDAITVPGALIPPAHATFSTDAGAVTPESELNAGTAKASFSAPSAAGIATVTATLDGETVSNAIQIAAEPSPPQQSRLGVWPSINAVWPSGLARRPRLILSAVGKRVSRGGRVKLRLRCQARVRCRGALEILRSKGRRVGRVRFSIRAGHRRTLAVGLSRSARRVLKRAGHLNLIARTRDATAGNTRLSASTQFRIRR